MTKNKTVADDRDGQRAERCANHCASAAEQTRAAKHDRRDDVELEAASGVRRTAAQTRGDDDSRHRRGETADRIDRKGDPLGVHARPAHRFGVGADASDISAERRFVENDVAGDEDDDSDDGGHGRAENPAAADLVERALRIDGNRIALGQEKRRAADCAEASKRHDERGYAFVGDEEALRETDDDAKSQHQDHDGRPRHARLQRNGRKRIDEREDRTDGKVNSSRGDDESHGDGDDHQRCDLAQDVEEVRLREKRVGDERKDDDHHRKEDGDADDPAAVVDQDSQAGQRIA